MTSGAAATCQVVPDIASFAVDDGFTYRVPENLAVTVGSRVRIRVGGRRMRGFVTAVFGEQPEREPDLPGPSPHGAGQPLSAATHSSDSTRS